MSGIPFLTKFLSDFSASVRYLTPLDIHRVVLLIDQIGHLHKFVTFLLQCRDQRIQCLGGVFGAVVAEDDRAVAEMLVTAYGIDNGIHAVVLPVKRIHVRYTLDHWIFRTL